MGAFASHRKRGRLQVPYGRLQNTFIDPVINREFDMDLRNTHVSHDFRSIYFEHALVFSTLFITDLPLDPCFTESFVVRSGIVQDLLVILFAHRSYGITVLHDCPCLVKRVPVVCNRRIEDEPDAGCETRNQDHC